MAQRSTQRQIALRGWEGYPEAIAASPVEIRVYLGHQWGMRKILILLALLFPLLGDAAESKGERILSEFARLRELVAKTKPEYQVGGVLNGKRFGDHELLWQLSEGPGEHEQIRIYRDKGEKSTAVTFFRSRWIVPGRTVVRRFVGPEPTGWRNDTVDADTREYLGSQGAQRPIMDARDGEILRIWDIRSFD